MILLIVKARIRSLNFNKFRTLNRNTIMHGFPRIQNSGVKFKITVDCNKKNAQSRHFNELS